MSTQLRARTWVPTLLAALALLGTAALLLLDLEYIYLWLPSRVPAPAPAAPQPSPPLMPSLRHQPPAFQTDWMDWIRIELPRSQGYRRELLELLVQMLANVTAQRQPRTYVWNTVGKPDWMREDVDPPWGPGTWVRTVNGTWVTTKVYPISIPVPDELIQPAMQSKGRHFSTVIPGKKDTYIFKIVGTIDELEKDVDRERNYYHDVARSFFTVTFKKAGWDCVRHVEILAMGTLPLFTDIDLCPPYTMAMHPKAVYHKILEFPGLVIHGKRQRDNFELSLDMTQFDSDLYAVAVHALLHYTRSVLSARAMAQYVLDTMNASNARSVLFLTPDQHQDGDCLTDSVLYGFKTLLGQAAVVDVHRRSPTYRPHDKITEASFLPWRAGSFYGQGFTYTSRVFEFPNVTDRSNIEARIRAREFDVVIFGMGVFTGQQPHFDLVCNSYPPSQVAMMHGDDNSFMPVDFLAWHPCIGTYFAREMYETGRWEPD